MAKKRTSKIKKQASGLREVNLRARSGRVFWCQTKKSGRRLMRLAAILVLSGMALWAGTSVVQQVFMDSDEFALAELHLWSWDSNEEAPKLINQSRLQEVTGLTPGVNIFAFPLGKLEQQIESLPEIKQAHVTRRFHPSRLCVRVDELKPVAWIDSPRQRIVARDYERGMLVDEDGLCFLPSESMRKSISGLPVITTGERGEDELMSGKKVQGREFLRALELVKLSQRYLVEAGLSLPVVGLRNDFSLLAKTHTGSLVTFGLYEHERQLEDLLLILEHARQSSRGIESVNLIPERNIPVVFAQVGRPPRGPATLLESNLEAILTRG